MRAVVSLVSPRVWDLASETAWDPGRFHEKEQEVPHWAEAGCLDWQSAYLPPEGVCVYFNLGLLWGQGTIALLQTRKLKWGEMNNLLHSRSQ